MKTDLNLCKSNFRLPLSCKSSFYVTFFNFRKIALTIILTRAGLDLDPVAMKKFFFTVIKLALIPWTFECVLCAVMANLLLGLPWDWGEYLYVHILISIFSKHKTCKFTVKFDCSVPTGLDNSGGIAGCDRAVPIPAAWQGLRCLQGHPHAGASGVRR